ncbi:3-oxoadipate CoA-transferase, partial [Klebsiella pneumoniae]
GERGKGRKGGREGSPGGGGGMDLARGAGQVVVMMDNVTREGECKRVAQCSYPLTGVGCVSRIYTDLAVIDITDRGPVVREIFNGLSFEELQRITPVALTFQQLAESA